MTTPIPVGLIGADEHAEELRRHDAPIPGLQIRHCAPSADGEDHSRCIQLASHFGASFTPEWKAVTEDPLLSAVLVFAPAATRTKVVAHALTAGKCVLCPFPAARDAASLASVTEARAKGGGILLTLGEIAGTAAGAHTLDALQSGRLGRLYSIWAATRSRRSKTAKMDVVEQHGWPLLDFMLAAISAPPVRVHTTLTHLFEPGPHVDTAVILLRFQNGLIATIELSRCLPPLMPVPPMGEVEIEAIGTREVIHIEPYNTSVRVYGDSEVTVRPWIDGAVLRVLPQLVAAVHGGAADNSSLPRNEWAVSIMEQVRLAESLTAAKSGA
jgi:predicted dehydrogenase